MAGFASGKNWGTTPDASVFTEDIGSATRLATSGSFSRYLTEQIVENSAMIQSGLIQTDARLNNVTGVLLSFPFLISWITRKRTLILPLPGGRLPLVLVDIRPRSTPPALSTVPS